MNRSVIECLIRDTIRQSLASGVFWLMLAVTGLCILFCLSVGDRPAADGTDAGAKVIWFNESDNAVREQSFLFGAIHHRYSGPREEQVRKVHFFLGGLGAKRLDFCSC